MLFHFNSILASYQFCFILSSLDFLDSFEQVVVYDFYLRIFLSIHEDVIGEGGEHECSPTSTRVKDYMREGDAKCMLQSWADILVRIYIL
jgi:hypothetical protein